MEADPIRVIFVGTAKIGAPTLRALQADNRFEVPMVISQPDKPAGRKMELKNTPIKQVAQELNLPLKQPEKFEEILDELKEHKPDFLVVMAYGQLLNEEALAVPKIAPINLHVSLLPKYRGASPIQSAILNGDEMTGVSVMQMAEAMDAGPVYKAETLAIAEDETAETLHNKLADLTAQITPDTLVRIKEGLAPKEQDEPNASYCRKIQKSDGELDFSEPSEAIDRKIRAFTPWPGTYTFFNGKRLKIIEAEAAEGKLEPGLVQQEDETLYVGTGEGRLKLLTIQLEGKSPTPAISFIKGNPDFINIKLG